MHRTAFVTCMYNNLHGTIYGGRNRFNAYLESMKSISKLETAIYCFTSGGEIEQLDKAFVEHGISGVKLLEMDLFKEDFHDVIMEIKKSDPENYVNKFFWKERSPHVMWGKTRMLRRIIETEKFVNNIFWIDAGLSSSSMIRHKFFPRIGEGLYYYSEGVFTPNFSKRLISLSKNKIVALLHTVPNNQPIPQHYNDSDYTLTNVAMIGGIFGGNVELMAKFCDKFDTYIPKMYQRREMFSEESIYSGINNDNKEWFENFYFDTFYHEDWPHFTVGSSNTFSNIIEGFI